MGEYAMKISMWSIVMSTVALAVYSADTSQTDLKWAGIALVGSNWFRAKIMRNRNSERVL
jgi:hypothetical protein